MPHRDPVVDQDFDGAPHDDPARNDETLLQSYPEGSGDEIGDQLGDGQKPYHQDDGQGQRDLPCAPSSPTVAPNPLEHIREVRMKGLLDLPRRTRVF